MTDIEKLIHEIFNKIFREINNSSLNLKDTFDTIAPELRKLTLEINKSGDDGINIVWMNFWSSDFEFVRFSNVSGEFVCDKDKLKDSGISNDINIYSIEKSNYNKYILSSRNLLRKLGVEDEIFALNKNSKDKFNATQFSLKISEDEDKKLKELKELYSSKEIDINNKYKESYRIFSKEENNGIVTVPFLLDLGKDNKTKFLNWIFWLYNLYDSETWDYIFYLDGFFSSFGHKEKFITTNDIHCNIGISLNNSELSTILVLIKKLRTLISKLATLNAVYIHKEIILQSQLKTAIISILVDSFSHNISAHSLAALKWWFEQRYSKYDERIYVGEKNKLNRVNKLTNLEIKEFNKDTLKDCAEKTTRYFNLLGLDDSSNDENYTSLAEIVKFANFNNYELLSYKTNDNDERKYRFPVPIDGEISSFMRFLRDKAAFWSGVTRDLPFGGKAINLYQILWDDFANNPLYLGSIVNSDGINKLNIRIKLPHIVKDKILEFAVIDLSVIEYEKKLYNSNKTIAASNIKKEYATDEKGEKTTIEYSNYALVYPGEHHKIIREELQKNDYNIFLPGGIVGEHALFTIFENSIRNVKHYEITDEIKKDGLNLNIEIEPSKLMKNNEVPLGSQDHKLFKVGVYLDNSQNENSESKKILDKLNELAVKPIMEEGNPRLGGNSQDKICVAMLLNNKFITVDPNYVEKDFKERTDYYYCPEKNRYWIGFEETEETKRIKKYFFLWKGDFIYTLHNEDKLKNDNLSRFKFVYIDSDDIYDDLLISLKEKGVIRLLNKKDIEKIVNEIAKFHSLTEFKDIYESEETTEIKRKFCKKLLNNKKLEDFEKYSIYLTWLKKFIDNKSPSFCFLGCYDKVKEKNKPKSKMLIKDFEYEGMSKDCNTDSIKLYAHHTGETFGFKDSDILFYRSHGWFRKNIIKYDSFELYDNVDGQPKFNEFVELLYSKICIIDNRINMRINKDNLKKYKDLGLEIYEEFEEKDNGNWNNVKKKINKYNFFVVHLSFIESFDCVDNETEINSFFEEGLGFNKKEGIPEHTIIVITTGRGRSNWLANLNPIYKKNTIFKPIESILDAVENALSFKDDIQLKYNLTKVLFGS